MSHFFQRIASSVTRPSAEPRLRPMVGSLYVPADLPAAPAAPFESVNTEFSAPEFMARPVRENASSAPRSTRSSPHHAAGVPSPSLPQQPGKSDRAEIASPQLLLPPEPIETRLPDSAAPGPDRLNNAPTTHDPDSADRRNSASGLARMQEAISTQRSLSHHQPLLPAIQPSPAGDPLRRAAQTAAPMLSSAQRSLAGDPARRAAAPAREPDEIFIHIGRVEVAAVPPPAPRAAPAPQRKSINLSEYLRRSNGRTR